MTRFIKISDNRVLNLDALREIIWHENGDIEIRYSSVEFDLLHFDSLSESRKVFNSILTKLELEEKSYTPKCFSNPIENLCESISGKTSSRIKNTCIINNIRTIGDLVAFGKYKFEKQPNIGTSCISAITIFLKDTYGYIWKY
jgi:hypothetical protein